MIAYLALELLEGFYKFWYSKPDYGLMQFYP